MKDGALEKRFFATKQEKQRKIVSVFLDKRERIEYTSCKGAQRESFQKTALLSGLPCGAVQRLQEDAGERSHNG